MWKSHRKIVRLLKKLCDQLLEEAKEVHTNFPFRSYIWLNAYQLTYVGVSFFGCKTSPTFAKFIKIHQHQTAAPYHKFLRPWCEIENVSLRLDNINNLNVF